MDSYEHLENVIADKQIAIDFLRSKIAKRDQRISNLEGELKMTIESATTMITWRDNRILDLSAALQPFAKAADEVPDGLRSVLRIPEAGDFSKTIYLSATTDHLLVAKNALKRS